MEATGRARPEQAAAAFAYPFRPGWGRAWAVGVPLAVLFPVGLVPLLGYSVRATRTLLADPASGPPPWRLDLRLLQDGLLLLLLLALITVPFAAALPASAGAAAGVLPVTDPFLRRGYGILAAAAPLLLGWAVLALAVVPGAIGAYAAGGPAVRLFDPAAAYRRLRTRFWAWNVAGVPIVTAWALAVFGLLLCVVGAAFGAFYALLVSAHASATLAD